MPKIQIELNETHKSILRPAALNVVRTLMEATGLPSDTKVNYPGVVDSVIQNGSALSDSNATAALPSRNLITIDVSEDYPEDWTLATTVNEEDNVAVFIDEPLGILVKPVYTKSKVTISIKAKFVDRPSAEKWRNQFRRASQMLRTTNVHEITYHWEIPDVILILLYQLHAMRERVAPYNQTLETWMRANLSAKATTLTNQAGTEFLLAIAETQASVIGWFEFDSQPNALEYTKETGTWETSFDYSFYYEKPVAVHMRYPLMVHNQLINSEFRSSELPYKLSQKFLTPSVQRVLFDSMTHGRFQFDSVLSGVSLPKFDDWLPANTPASTSMLMRIMTSVDTLQPTSLLDLKSLGSYALDPLLIEYMKARGQANARLGGSIIKVTLYAKSTMLADDFITIDSNLLVNAIEPLSLRTPYHVLISIIDDFGTLSKGGRDELALHGELALKYFDVLDPHLKYMDIWPKLTSNGYITKTDFKRISDYLDERSSMRYVHGTFGMRTVGYFVIESHGN